MTIRKRKNPTGGFGMLPPYQPITGEREQLITPGEDPYCAMMQVVEKDTHCNYVVCRGYDPRTRRYWDYASGNSAKPGVAVAKPFWNRMKGVYRIGQVFPAFLPLPAGGEESGIIVPQIGQNPGYVAPDGTECKGHPDLLTEEIELLTDDDGNYINWMLIDGGKVDVRFCTKDAHPGDTTTVFEAYGPGAWNSATRAWDFTCDADHTHKIIDKDYGVPAPGAGAQGYATWEADDVYGKILLVKTFDCETRGTCNGCS